MFPNPEDKYNIRYVETPGLPDFIIQGVGEETKKLFIQMLDKVLNTWEHAPGELKTLGDIMKHGEPLQKYNCVYVKREVNSNDPSLPLAGLSEDSST